MSMSTCQESENFWAHIVSCAWPTYLLASSKFQLGALPFCRTPAVGMIAEHRPLFSSFSWVSGSHRRSGAAVGGSKVLLWGLLNEEHTRKNRAPKLASLQENGVDWTYFRLRKIDRGKCSKSEVFRGASPQTPQYNTFGVGP